MRFRPIASGSSGNCTYVGSDTTHILIDAGISCKRILEGLKELELSAQDLSGIFITHEHADHIKGLAVLAKKYEVPIFMLPGTRKKLSEYKEYVACLPLIRELKADERLILKDMEIKAFRTSHDAAESCGYVVKCDHKKAGICTDLGEYTEYTVESLKELDVCLLESNHDVRMLEAGPYPYYLKKRILSGRGHLSNDSCGALLESILNGHMKRIYLGHLSKENNLPILALESVRAEITMGSSPYQGKELPIVVAKRDTSSELTEV